MTPARHRMAAFEQALRRFHEVLERPEDDVVRDASIQPFEFTFEMYEALRTYAGPSTPCSRLIEGERRRRAEEHP